MLLKGKMPNSEYSSGRQHQAGMYEALHVGPSIRKINTFLKRKKIQEEIGKKITLSIVIASMQKLRTYNKIFENNFDFYT